mmetsp:Transcript_22381/g.36128  ORF Transcript_22381/g.36128 Transcript_22381/m.36128 type:complete len:248 (-) Transcript_22381:388-1131(-)
MSTFFRTCLDGHRCENGSSCKQHPLEEGTYYCDCSTASGDFAGLFCEYEAETYCQLPQETSSTWFCTNQGTCVLASGATAQWSCDCPADYEGPHCQFIKGNVPRDWPGFDFDPATASTTTMAVSERGMSTGALVATILGTLVGVALIAIVIIRKRHRDAQLPAAAQNAARDPSEALKLDADGGVLQEIVSQSFSRTPNSTLPGSANGQHYEFENGIEEESVDGSVEVPHPNTKYTDNPKNGYGGNIL